VSYNGLKSLLGLKAVYAAAKETGRLAHKSLFKILPCRLQNIPKIEIFGI
jgi:hypothetical protein